ncbi:MAG: hypothetical protein ACKPKO_20505, partial [Candidatus Fonsibacter sp.]
FNQIRVNGFVVGKENYIFSESYIFSAFGDDFIGEEKIKTQMQKAKVVQDSLKRHGVDLLLVFAPGKGEYCQEFVEDKYKHPVKNTNHAEFDARASDMMGTFECCCRGAGCHHLQSLRDIDQDIFGFGRPCA